MKKAAIAAINVVTRQALRHRIQTTKILLVARCSKGKGSGPSRACRLKGRPFCGFALENPMFLDDLSVMVILPHDDLLAKGESSKRIVEWLATSNWTGYIVYISLLELEEWPL